MFLQDTFSGSSGTLLENHTSDSGAAWWRHPSYPSAPIDLSGTDTVIAASASDTVYLSSAIPPSADQTVSWTYVQQADNAGCNGGIVIRADPTNNTFYWFVRQCQPAENWGIFKRLNGSVTQLALSSGAAIANGNYNLVCSVIGSTLTFSVNGTVVCTAIDTSITAAGRVGISFYDGAGGIQVGDLSASATLPYAVISVADANLFFSPFNWYSDNSTFGESACPGAYFKCGFSGTSAAAIVDVSKLIAGSVAAADYPLLGWSIDGGPLQTHQLTSSDAILSLASGLASGSHTLMAMLIAIGGGSDKWNMPQNVLRITGLQLDAGSATQPASNAIAIRSKRGLLFGDSISEGRQNSSVSGVTASAFASYVKLLSDAMDMEIGAVCYQGQGFTPAHAAAGNVPPLPTSWNAHDASHSRLISGLLAPVPDYIFIAEGTNDSAAPEIQVTSAVSSLLASIRAAAPASKLIVLVPPNRTQSLAIAAGASNGLLVDLENNGTIGLSGGNSPTLYSDVDGTHPNVAGQARLGSLYIDPIAAALAVAPAIFTAGSLSSSGSRALSQGIFEAA